MLYRLCSSSSISSSITGSQRAFLAPAASRRLLGVATVAAQRTSDYQHSAAIACFSLRSASTTGIPGLNVAVTCMEAATPAAAASAPARKMVLVVAAALIDAQGRVLLAQRPPGKPLAGLWEFPGGKVDAGELPEAALARELQEELGVQVDTHDLVPLTFASHTYDNFHLLMPLYECRRWCGAAAPQEGQQVQWAGPELLQRCAMPAADIPLIPHVLAAMRLASRQQP